MRNLSCLLVALCLALCASSQKVYFIYFQTDNGASFYVKNADRIHSSSAPGYLTLSNFIDSTYQFAIGLSASGREYRFVVPLEKRDRGFLIKSFDFGLGLFDLQTLKVIKPLVDESKKNVSYERRNDGFTNLLAKASGDTSLLYVQVAFREEVIPKDIVKEEPKEEPRQEAPKPKVEEVLLKKDTVAATRTVVQAEEKRIDSLIADQENKTVSSTVADTLQSMPDGMQDSVVVTTMPADTLAMASDSKTDSIQISPAVEDMPAQVFKRSQVKKYSESSTSEGFGLVFFDNYGDGIDTIRLIIPNPRIVLKQPDNKTAEDSSNFMETRKPDVKAETDMATVKPLPKSNCPAIANNSDFLKLRKNMAAEDTDEEMVDEAKKYFKGKCFSTEQIKNLSALFLTSAGKYQFFDAAWLHVTDPQQFASLISELKDEYYIKRFKALIGE